MSEHLQETFVIQSTFASLQDWLESWRMANDKNEVWNVDWSSYGGESTLSWHVPASLNKLADVSQITFKVLPRDVELLDVTVSYADDTDIINYVTPLLERIRKRWVLQGDTPDFSKLVNEPTLSEILNSRWRESQLTLNAGAYLSTIILLGSILEGMLLYKIHSNKEQANKAKSAPKDRYGKVRPDNEWSLDAMITVAHECGWLDRDVHGYAVALRGYRNLVHPREQIESGIYPDEDTCLMSLPIIKAALSDLVR